MTSDHWAASEAEARVRMAELAPNYNIQCMKLFQELKSAFPCIPDMVVRQCMKQLRLIWSFNANLSFLSNVFIWIWIPGGSKAPELFCFLQPWTQITKTDIRPSCSLWSFANCGAKIDQFNYVENSCILKLSHQFNVSNERLIWRPVLESKSGYIPLGHLQWELCTMNLTSHFFSTLNFLFDFKI